MVALQTSTPAELARASRSSVSGRGPARSAGAERASIRCKQPGVAAALLPAARRVAFSEHLAHATPSTSSISEQVLDRQVSSDKPRATKWEAVSCTTQMQDTKTSVAMWNTVLHPSQAADLAEGKQKALEGRCLCSEALATSSAQCLMRSVSIQRTCRMGFPHRKPAHELTLNSLAT